jgi:hypothetical protein
VQLGAALQQRWLQEQALHLLRLLGRCRRHISDNICRSF